MVVRKVASFAVVATLVLTGLQSLAEDSAESEAASAASAELLAEAFASETALSPTELGEQRAKAKFDIEEVTINDSDQEGQVTGNAALNNRTGRNTIDGDAFVGASGFINSVQNTGNNVLIQNSTIINVSVEP